MTMRITVRLFAMQRQQAGWRVREFELPDRATVADAWAAVVALHPDLAAGTASLRFARNAVYADPADLVGDGDEVAVIPPVAGGSADPVAGGSSRQGMDDPEAGRVRRIELSPEPFHERLLEDLRRTVASPGTGAVVLFVGQTRETPGTPAPGQEEQAARFAGRAVLGLDYEAFESMALAVLAQVADEIEARFGVRRLAILHRVGAVPLGEASVVIAVAAAHRSAAFDACRYAIEELKARAPIWKSERFADGSVWVGAPARTSAAGTSAAGTSAAGTSAAGTSASKEEGGRE
jgi:molybdopterin synthase catalytic subunit